MITNITIRDLRPEDRDEIFSILNTVSLFSKNEMEMAIDLVDYYIKDGDTEYTFKVAVNGNSKVLGYICYGQADLSDTYWEILWMAVDVKSRQKKIGITLVKTVENIVRKNNQVGLLLETSSMPGYESARKFYEGIGYKEICRIKDFFSIGNDKIIYEKRFLK